MSTLPEGREADYTGRGAVPGYDRQVDVDRRLATLKQAVQEPTMGTLDEMALAISKIEYRDMMELAGELAKRFDSADIKQEDVASVLHAWATNRVSGSQPLLQPSCEEAPAKRPAVSVEASSRRLVAEQKAHLLKHVASRAATSPTRLADDGEGGSPGFGYNPGELGQ